MGKAARTADEILAQAKQLPSDERRRVAEILLEELDRDARDDADSSDDGPYTKWLEAAGTVHSDFADVSTDKYKHVAEAAMQGHPRR